MSDQDTTQPDTQHADDQVDEHVDDQDGTDGGEDTDADPDGADKLGDAGKKALEAMKADRRAARAQLREWTSFARELGAKDLAELKAMLDKADGDGDAPDTETIRKQAKAEAAAEVLRERALDKAVVKAAGKLADPEDARIYLAGSIEEFLDGDKLDQDAIAEAIDDLLKSKPYLAAQGGKRFGGSADGGARNGKSKPSQLTREDLKRMSPAEIVKARSEGRLADVLGAK